MKGHCALLVNEKINRSKTINIAPPIRPKEEEQSQSLKASIIKASPNRFVNKVNIPPFKLFQF